jgi:hypothetical protein
MKRNIRYTIIIAAIGIIGFSSCKKNYHCQCTYNNQLKLTRDLGSQTKDDATTLCESYDTTVTGEKWNCTIY